MNRDDIIRMAREAGIEHHENVDEMRSPFCDGVWFEDLEHFSALVAAAEREECAQMVEHVMYGRDGCDRTAAAIRAMGEK
jgi:hypothetical protein